VPGSGVEPTPVGGQGGQAVQAMRPEAYRADACPLGLLGQAEKEVNEVPGLLRFRLSANEAWAFRSARSSGPIKIGGRIARLVMPGREIRRRDGVTPIVLEILR